MLSAYSVEVLDNLRKTNKNTNVCICTYTSSHKHTHKYTQRKFMIRNSVISNCFQLNINKMSVQKLTWKEEIFDMYHIIILYTYYNTNYITTTLLLLAVTLRMVTRTQALHLGRPSPVNKELEIKINPPRNYNFSPRYSCLAWQYHNIQQLKH